MGTPINSELVAGDGRVQRGVRSREAIVAAMVELVGEGVLRPTAQQVAERAGVNIRTVFRHFSEMEGLYAAMDARLRREVEPLFRAGVPQGDASQRAREVVRRRVALFEKIANYRRSANLLRGRSPYLEREHGALGGELRADLLRWLPELKQAPREQLEALDLVTSFEAWDRLRCEQRLKRDATLRAMQHLVLALIEQGPR